MGAGFVLFLSSLLIGDKRLKSDDLESLRWCMVTVVSLEVLTFKSGMTLKCGRDRRALKWKGGMTVYERFSSLRNAHAVST